MTFAVFQRRKDSALSNTESDYSFSGRSNRTSEGAGERTSENIDEAFTRYSPHGLPLGDGRASVR